MEAGRGSPPLGRDARDTNTADKARLRGYCSPSGAERAGELRHDGVRLAYFIAEALPVVQGRRTSRASGQPLAKSAGAACLEGAQDGRGGTDAHDVLRPETRSPAEPRGTHAAQRRSATDSASSSTAEPSTQPTRSPIGRGPQLQLSTLIRYSAPRAHPHTAAAITRETSTSRQQMDTAPGHLAGHRRAGHPRRPAKDGVSLAYPTARASGRAHPQGPGAGPGAVRGPGPGGPQTGAPRARNRG